MFITCGTGVSTYPLLIADSTLCINCLAILVFCSILVFIGSTTTALSVACDTGRRGGATGSG